MISVMQPIPKQATCMGHWHADTSSQELGWHSSKQSRERTGEVTGFGQLSMPALCVNKDQG